MCARSSAPPRRPARPRSPRPSARLFAHDRALGHARVAGADEAGRGCLAGPLVAAAVCLDLERMSRSARRALSDLDDSKRIDAPTRARLAEVIICVADQVTIVVASAATIDRDGLHRTNLRLLADALRALRPAPGASLVDGFRLGAAAPEHRAVAGGDRRSACIAAASVIAKTTRDRLMQGPIARAHPNFGFATNVGYATPEHHLALREHGLSPLHRRSFRSSAYPGARWDGSKAPMT